MSAVTLDYSKPHIVTTAVHGADSGPEAVLNPDGFLFVLFLESEFYCVEGF